MGLKGKELEEALLGVEKENSLISHPDEFCREFPESCNVKNGKKYLYGLTAKFWQEIDQLDPLAPLKDLNCKIFSIHGTSDYAISSENDGGAIQAAMSKNPNYTSLVMPELDHFLIKTATKKSSVQDPLSKAKIHPDFIPAINNVLLDWVK